MFIITHIFPFLLSLQKSNQPGSIYISRQISIFPNIDLDLIWFNKINEKYFHFKNSIKLAAFKVSLNKLARLIIRLLFRIVSDSVFVRLRENINKYWDDNAVWVSFKIANKKLMKYQNEVFSSCLYIRMAGF